MNTWARNQRSFPKETRKREESTHREPKTRAFWREKESHSKTEIKDVQLTELLRLVMSGGKSMPLSSRGVLLESLEVLPKAELHRLGESSPLSSQ